MGEGPGGKGGGTPVLRIQCMREELINFLKCEAKL